MLRFKKSSLLFVAVLCLATYSGLQADLGLAEMHGLFQRSLSFGSSPWAGSFPVRNWNSDNPRAGYAKHRIHVVRCTYRDLRGACRLDHRQTTCLQQADNSTGVLLAVVWPVAVLLHADLQQ